MSVEKSNGFLKITGLVSYIGGIAGALISVTTIIFSFEMEDTQKRQILLVISLVGLLIAIILLSLWIYKRSSNKNTQLQKLIEENLDVDAFRNYWKEPIYIPMNITLDPEAKGKCYPFSSYLLSLIKKNQPESRYICLLGDSGSGKTDALVHFLIYYINHFLSNPSMPTRINLYTMNVGYEKLWEEIQEDYPTVKDRRKSILLLDALDECKDAQESLVNTFDNNPSLFMQKLADDTKDFALVVVTCRKQFFMREEYLPEKTSVEIGNPLGADPFLHWQKLYLSQLNNRQVRRYLFKQFLIDKSFKRYFESRRIVRLCKDVFHRPMILSHLWIVMDVLVNRREALTMKDIYDAIVYYWIQREAKNNKEEIDRLLNVSISLAGYMYKNKLVYLTEEHYDLFCKEYEIEDKDNLLRVKSLLSNDKEGYKFSHKTYYEYLLAYWFFLHPEEIASVSGLNFTLDIYKEICDNYKSDVDKSVIEQKLKIKEVSNEKLAEGLLTLVKELYSINSFYPAIGFCQESLTYYRQLSEKMPDTYLPLLAKTLNSNGTLNLQIRQYKQAEADFQEALGIRRQLAKKGSEDYLNDLATTLDNLAVLHIDTHHFEDCKVVYQEVLGIRRKLVEKNQKDYLLELGKTLNNIGGFHVNIRHYEEAEVELQEAITIYRQLLKENSDTILPYLAMTLRNIGYVYLETNRIKEAEEKLQEALNIRLQLAKEHSDANLQELAQAYNCIGSLHLKTEHYKEAESAFQQAYHHCRQLNEKTFNAFLPDLAMILDNLALTHHYNKKNKESEAKFKEALAIRRKLAENNPDAFLLPMAETLARHASAHDDTTSYDEDVAEFQEALDIMRKLYIKSPDVLLQPLADALNNLAFLHYKNTNFDEAERGFQESLTYYRQLEEKNSGLYLPNKALTHFNLALVYVELYTYDQAENEALESLDIYKKMAEISHEQYDKSVEKVSNYIEYIRELKLSITDYSEIP